MRDSGTKPATNGRFVFPLFAALADFERDLIRERTRAGLAVAMARGRKCGRRPVMTPKKLARARALIDKGLTVREAAARVMGGKTSLYESLARRVSAKTVTPRKESMKDW
ncbi:MAG: recombinase family protein [Methylacidiphilaceae bacterium]|nr:recombinase family protein [Candidatus Methylacidiphilaceae bacterium]